jgi:hypothetical protein
MTKLHLLLDPPPKEQKAFCTFAPNPYLHISRCRSCRLDDVPVTNQQSWSRPLDDGVPFRTSRSSALFFELDKRGIQRQLQSASSVASRNSPI